MILTLFSVVTAVMISRLLLFVALCSISILGMGQSHLREIMMAKQLESDELIQAEALKNANIQQIDYQQYIVKKGDTLQGPLNYIGTLDATGHVVKDTVENPRGFSHQYQYNAEGKLLQFAYQNPLQTTYTKLEYNQNVLVSRELVYEDSAHRHKLEEYRYEYNELAQLTSLLKFGAENLEDTLVYMTFTYDEKGRIMQRYELNNERGYSIESTDYYDYSQAGIVTVSQQMLDNEEIIKAFGYNEQQQLTEYINVKRKRRVVLKYNTEGLLVRKELYTMPDNLMIGYLEYQYTPRP